MTKRHPFTRWSPELRRAVMRVRPEFFAWSPDQQERYGVDIPNADRDRLDQALLQELFGQTFATAKEARKAAGDLPLSRLGRWNETFQPLVGIGEDAFSLNDFIPDNKTLLDFPTLRALDEADNAFQEQRRKDEDPAYVIKPYRGDLYLSWARLYVDDRFTYATLSMAAGYIYSELDALVFDVVKECIPHEYVPGKNHGKADGNTWQWDMRRDAGGQEALLDELQHRAMLHAMEQVDGLKERWHALGRHGVYIFENPDETAPEDFNLHFVFTDIEALDRIRFRSFVRDCRAIELPAAELTQGAEIETAGMTAWIKAQHQHLLATFDPKVATLRKKRKVMIHKDAFKDLE